MVALKPLLGVTFVQPFGNEGDILFAEIPLRVPEGNDRFESKVDLSPIIALTAANRSRAVITKPPDYRSPGRKCATNGRKEKSISRPTG
jgi:hypothetical protein